MVVVEQNLEFIRALAGRVLVIHRGRIVRELEPTQLADADLVAEFVGPTG